MSDEQLAQFAERIDHIDRLIKFAWGIGCVVVAITLWVAGVNFGLTQAQREITELKASRANLESSINRIDRNLVRIAWKLGVQIEDPKN